MYNKLNDKEFCKEVDKLLKQFFSKKNNINKILVEHFNKSIFSIRQRFKINRKKTIGKYRDEIIANIACKKLKNKSCFEVMLYCGFTHSSHFAIWFKKAKGVFPSEYYERILN